VVEALQPDRHAAAYSIAAWSTIVARAAGSQTPPLAEAPPTAHYTAVRARPGASGKKSRHLIGRTLVLALAGGLVGCSSIYYAAMEELGWERRDVLVSRVDTARDSQSAALTRFLDALGERHDLAASDAADLPKQLGKLRVAYQAAKAQAVDVRRRIAAVEVAGSKLFSEWHADVAATREAGARTRAQELCDASQARYQELLAAMHGATDAMPPVLDALGAPLVSLDKGTPSPQAVAAVQPSLAATAQLVDGLARQLQQAIGEADVFTRQLGLD
jgi:hypothetical protein